MSEFRRGALRLALCTVVLAGSSVSAPAGQTPLTVAVPVSSDTPVRMAANGVREMAERRCGWLANPTPANFWLTDADGTWTLSEQGRDLGNRFHDISWPEFAADQWVETNGSYGYGCACFDGVVDHRSANVVRIDRLAPRPLNACLADPALPSIN